MTRVLVVDDSPFIFKAVKRALEPHGYEIVGHAENGKQGLEMISSLSPDIITLDVTMPIMDGLEVAAALNCNMARRVIMLSAMGDDDLIAKAQQHGIKYFVSKPFKPEQLLDHVLSILRELP